MPSTAFKTVSLKKKRFITFSGFLRSMKFRDFQGLPNPWCDILHAHSHLHTQARSIIQMSDEQYSQYVGMLYWVDLKMWPLCSSTCREQQSTGSLGVHLHISFHINMCFFIAFSILVYLYLVIPKSKCRCGELAVWEKCCLSCVMIQIM